ncbi:TPA: hypothetical protein ACPJ1T_003399 [Vibrio diabolicus]|uniref:hypothetical protein n=1 Tax=Vibrio TaxID=662 RepID=UPI001112836E|nr:MULTISPECIES: hypothetical protein [Vibrio]MCR9474290.1 hypothetical protein [Vibrio diabolicus]MCS0325570.1 hypothetical protein [Vibrio diabolicus]MDV5053778.1 hypothetical protein [Vibrio sp. T13N]TNC13063.1 hypothetical protein FHG74_04500 [Vibrio diabolicus]
MVKLVLITAVALQIGIAISSEGLARSLAELTAFLIAIALVVTYKNSKQEPSSSQHDERTTNI